MNKTFKSKPLSKIYFIVFIVVGALLASIVLFVLQDFFGDDWVFFENNLVLNLVIYYALGVLLSTWYVQRDYVMYNNRSLTVHQDALEFKKNEETIDQFTIKELTDIRKTKFIYRLVNAQKVTFILTPSEGRRSKYKMLLLDNEAVFNLEKIVDPIRKEIHFEANK